jgi:hypothetical protein
MPESLARMTGFERRQGPRTKNALRRAPAKAFSWSPLWCKIFQLAVFVYVDVSVSNRHSPMYMPNPAAGIFAFFTAAFATVILSLLIDKLLSLLHFLRGHRPYRSVRLK